DGDDRSCPQAQEGTSSELAPDAAHKRFPGWLCIAQRMQGQADRLTAYAFGQVEHHGNKKRQGHYLVQLVLKEAAEQSGQDASSQVAAEPWKAIAKTGLRRTLDTLQVNADALKDIGPLAHVSKVK